MPLSVGGVRFRGSAWTPSYETSSDPRRGIGVREDVREVPEGCDLLLRHSSAGVGSDDELGARRQTDGERRARAGRTAPDAGTGAFVPGIAVSSGAGFGHSLAVIGVVCLLAGCIARQDVVVRATMKTEGVPARREKDQRGEEESGDPLRPWMQPHAGAFREPHASNDRPTHRGPQSGESS